MAGCMTFSDSFSDMVLCPSARSAFRLGHAKYIVRAGLRSQQAECVHSTERSPYGYHHHQ